MSDIFSKVEVIIGVARRLRFSTDLQLAVVAETIAEAFVKTFKRDYVRISPIPYAAAALALIDDWMEDYNTVHLHSRLGYRSPREYIRSQPAECPV